MVAARITKALSTPFKLNGHDMFVTTSIGIVLRGESHRTPDDLLRDADVALYRAKDDGRARFASTTPVWARRWSSASTSKPICGGRSTVASCAWTINRNSIFNTARSSGPRH